MAIVPDTRLGKLRFYETHLGPWTDNTAAIGLDPADMASLTARADATREAYNAFRLAQNTARAAAQHYFDLVADLHGAPGAGSDMIDAIKHHAQATDDPGVYTLAQLPPPATPSAAPPPGTPYKFAVTLNQDGGVGLRWRCDNPPGTRGTVYEVRRGENGGPMAFLATTGQRQFLDETIPANAGPLVYEVTAVRSTRRGRPGRFNLRFGSAGEGASEDAGLGGVNLAA